MKYEPNVWYDWHGGECPVPGDTPVVVFFGNDPDNADDMEKYDNMKAEFWDWDYDDEADTHITRFRVLNPQPTQTGPVRTVTRREIVPGQYGVLQVATVDVPNGQAWIRVSSVCTSDELTAAIETLTAIRDALAEQETQA